MPKPRLLIHSLIFPPDQVSTAYLYGDIAEGFINGGWDVEVFTTTPHYNFEGDFSKQSKRRIFHFVTNFHGARVVHIPQLKSGSGLVRGIYIMWFHLAFLIRALFGRSFDVILSPSPPPTIGFLNGLIAKLKGVKAVYNVQEIYPDILRKSGVNLSMSMFKLLSWMESKIYQWNSKVVTIDKQFAKVLMPRLDVSKLEVIPNFVDTEFYKPRNFDGDPELRFDGKYLVVYLGNLGGVQDWETILSAAKKLINNRRIQFLLVGGGSEFGYLKEKSLQMPNLEVWPYQTLETIKNIIARSDLHIISMNKASDHDGLPSKVLTILSSGKPVLVASSMDSPISRIVRESQNGMRVDRSNYNELAEAILNFSQGKYGGVLHAEKGRNFIIMNYSKEVVVERYVQLLRALLSP